MGIVPSYPPCPPGGALPPHHSPEPAAAQRRAIYRLLFIVAIVMGTVWVVASGFQASKMIELAEVHRHSSTDRDEAKRYENGIEPALQIFVVLAGAAGIFGAVLGLCGQSAGRWVLLIALLLLVACQTAGYSLAVIWLLRLSGSYETTRPSGVAGFWIYQIGFMIGSEMVPAVVIAGILATRWPGRKRRWNSA